MPTFSPVVCALDLHAESEPALVAAAELSARVGGPLHLVTVRPPDAPDVYQAPSDPDAAVRAVVEVYVDRALGAGACAELAPRIVVAREGASAAALVDYAAEVGAGVLVLGTHGRAGVQRFRLGSVAEAAVRQSVCPVLVIPNRSAGRVPGPDRPVLVPVDLREPSAPALQAAHGFAALYGAAVEALYVGGGPDADAPFSGAAGPAEAALWAAAAQAGCALAAAHVVEGAPARTIARLARERDAGAVVMGTHGRQGLAHAVWGSVTEDALRRLRCPLLAVRPQIDL